MTCTSTTLDTSTVDPMKIPGSEVAEAARTARRSGRLRTAYYENRHAGRVEICRGERCREERPACDAAETRTHGELPSRPIADTVVLSPDLLEQLRCGQQW